MFDWQRDAQRNRQHGTDEGAAASPSSGAAAQSGATPSRKSAQPPPPAASSSAKREKTAGRQPEQPSTAAAADGETMATSSSSGKPPPPRVASSAPPVSPTTAEVGGGQASVMGGGAPPTATRSAYGYAPTYAGTAYDASPTVVGVSSSALDPWRYGVRGVAAVALGGAAAFALYHLCPPPRAVLIAWCQRIVASSGDQLAAKRLGVIAAGGTPSSSSTPAATGGATTFVTPTATIAQYEVVRVLFQSHPVLRACVVALAPKALWEYALWLLDHSALVLRAIREGMRPRQSRQMRLRRWHHALLETSILAGGAAAGAAVAIWARWLIYASPRTYVVADLCSFVEQGRSSIETAKLQERIKLEAGADGTRTLWALMREALKIVPSRYPDVTAAAVLHGASVASQVQAAARSVWQKFAAYRALLLFRANDEDEADGGGEGTADAPIP